MILFDVPKSLEITFFDAMYGIGTSCAFCYLTFDFDALRSKNGNDLR